MATARTPRSSNNASKHVFREPIKPEFPTLDRTLLAPWIDAVTEYARAINSMNWFAAPADDRQGRLILEAIPNATAELKLAEAAINNLFFNQSYLLDALESCITLSFPGWKKIIHDLKKEQKVEFLKKVSLPELKNKVYFCLGRHILDVFCDPIKQSEKWALFLKELSQNIHNQIASQLSEIEIKLLVQQQVNAFEAIILNAAAYCLLKKWSDLYVPKAEEGTPEGRISRERERILFVLLKPLSATFNDSPHFLITLYQEYEDKKINIPALALRMAVSIEIDESLLKYVHKTEDLSPIQKLKEQLRDEVTEKLKEKFKDRETTSSDSEVDDKNSSTSAPAPSPVTTRARTMSMPAKPAKWLMTDPGTSSLFQKRRAALNPESEIKDRSLTTQDSPIPTKTTLQ